MPKFIGNTLKEKRKELKLTQKQLAYRLGVSLITVIRFENGTRIPDSDKLMELAELFNCKCEIFFE